MTTKRVPFSLRFVFYIPLTILVLEHVIASFYWFEKSASSESLKNNGRYPVSSAFLPTSTSAGSPHHSLLHDAFTLTEPLSLDILTRSSDDSASKACESNLQRVDDQVARGGEVISSLSPTIPRIVHQTAKTRCLTSSFAQASNQWKQWEDWSYYLHDDDAVLFLFRQHLPDFPILQHNILQHCVLYGTLRADVWRYLVLWVYGGVYADLDAVPAKWSPAMLYSTTAATRTTTSPATVDAFFVVEQFHMLSQYFMAVSPRHPLMWYALQQALLNLLVAPDVGTIAAALYTGPHALHRAYIQFRRDHNGDLVEEARPGVKPVKAGHFVGSYNRTVTVVGVGEHQNEYIDRDIIGDAKKREYRRLGMTFHQDDRKRRATGVSCLKRIMDEYYKKV